MESNKDPRKLLVSVQMVKGSYTMKFASKAHSLASLTLSFSLCLHYFSICALKIHK